MSPWKLIISQQTHHACYLYVIIACFCFVWLQMQMLIQEYCLYQRADAKQLGNITENHRLLNKILQMTRQFSPCNMRTEISDVRVGWYTVTFLTIMWDWCSHPTTDFSSSQKYNGPYIRLALKTVHYTATIFWIGRVARKQRWNYRSPWVESIRWKLLRSFCEMLRFAVKMFQNNIILFNCN